jgi:hypothetical protein
MNLIGLDLVIIPIYCNRKLVWLLLWKWFDEHSLNWWACMYNSGKHSLFLYTLTNFNAISHIGVILSHTNVLKIRQGSVISFARYDRGSM